MHQDPKEFIIYLFIYLNERLIQHALSSGFPSTTPNKWVKTGLHSVVPTWVLNLLKGSDFSFLSYPVFIGCHCLWLSLLRVKQMILLQLWYIFGVFSMFQLRSVHVISLQLSLTWELWGMNNVFPTSSHTSKTNMLRDRFCGCQSNSLSRVSGLEPLRKRYPCPSHSEYYLSSRLNDYW